MGPAALVRRLVAWPRRLRAVIGVFRRGGPRLLAARLRELHRHGCLRVVTPGPGGAPAILTTVFLDGDVITRATADGLARLEEHDAALRRVAADLTPASEVIGALAPLVALPFVAYALVDLLFEATMAAARGPLAVLRAVGVDLLVGVAAPALVIWLLGQLVRGSIRRRLR